MFSTSYNTAYLASAFTKPTLKSLRDFRYAGTLYKIFFRGPTESNISI